MAEKEQFKLLHNLNITIETAAYLDVGREWEKMVESFAYYRLYYVRSGSGKLVLTNKTIELEEGIYVFYPRVFHSRRNVQLARTLFHTHDSRRHDGAPFKDSRREGKMPARKTYRRLSLHHDRAKLQKRHIDERIFRGQRVEISSFPSDRRERFAFRKRIRHPPFFARTRIYRTEHHGKNPRERPRGTYVFGRRIFFQPVQSDVRRIREAIRYG